MSTVNAVTDLLSATAKQSEADRNVGGAMGKNDFLMLLAAQLRYQDPLSPQSDSDFAAQLAQFSSLEQMQNMNETLSAMAGYQSYSLVGKYVIATAYVDGVLSDIPGIVDSIFTRNGTTFAQIGEYIVPISAITDVFDANALLTPESLIQTSNNLLGRTVKAQVGKDTVIEGVVTRITVEQGVMYARIDDGTEVPKFVPVGTIFDIRQPGTPGDDKPVTEAESGVKDTENHPDPSEGLSLKPDGDGYIEMNDEGSELGRWNWTADKEAWHFEEF